MKRIIFLSILFVFLIMVFPVQEIFADSPLEVEYPDLTSVSPPTNLEKTALTDYFIYIFYFALAASGFIALISIVRGGFNYLTSSGMPEKVIEARNQITAAILGLIILFGSWLILYTINPDFINFRIKELRPSLPSLKPGVFLCIEKLNGEDGEDFVHAYWKLSNEAKNMDTGQLKQKGIKEQLENWQKKIDEKCWSIITSTKQFPPDLDKKFVQAHVVPSKNKGRYGAILYAESKYGGKNQVIYTPRFEHAAFNIDALNASSIKPFIIYNDFNRAWYVELFELIDNNAKYKKPERKKQGENYQKIGVNRNFGCYPINLPKKDNIIIGDHQFGSIDLEGSLIVILFKNRRCGERWGSITELYVLTNDDSNLYDNRPIGEWCGGMFDAYPCATSAVIVSGGIY